MMQATDLPTHWLTLVAPFDRVVCPAGHFRHAMDLFDG